METNTSRDGSRAPQNRRRHCIPKATSRYGNHGDQLKVGFGEGYNDHRSSPISSMYDEMTFDGHGHAYGDEFPAAPPSLHQQQGQHTVEEMDYGLASLDLGRSHPQFDHSPRPELQNGIECDSSYLGSITPNIAGGGVVHADHIYGERNDASMSYPPTYHPQAMDAMARAQLAGNGEPVYLDGHLYWSQQKEPFIPQTSNGYTQSVQNSGWSETVPDNRKPVQGTNVMTNLGQYSFPNAFSGASGMYAADYAEPRQIQQYEPPLLVSGMDRRTPFLTPETGHFQSTVASPNGDPWSPENMRDRSGDFKDMANLIDTSQGSETGKDQSTASSSLQLSASASSSNSDAVNELSDSRLTARPTDDSGVHWPSYSNPPQNPYGHMFRRDTSMQRPSIMISPPVPTPGGPYVRPETGIGHDSPAYPPSEQDSHLSIPQDDENVPGSPASSVQETSDTLTCRIEGCGAQFTGNHRKGNLARHRRTQHGRGDHSPVVFDCEGCTRMFRRKDARLKHYRTHHIELVTGGPVPRKYPPYS
ncbi:hypothetical protein P154DRAFT_573760 [Amniculicola lignicola CBS 123094]|uniref:C2H2-type domain-containing protein n=1 Tax=Amniculicola lignicola CBS 123094 TaxID=1392246 RepID=A0A6A5WLV0_9PLEO|nr:hypothetical protein P154DRAFT_573760 [Amniculicola lignicola CBS 123094]